MKFLLFYIALCLPVLCAAQVTDSITSDTLDAAASEVKTDAATDESTGRKPFLRPVCEILTAQAIPFAFNYLMTDPNISKITFKTIGDNFSLSNWVFDDDKFLTNQFAHPYHGNLYYNAFRTTGHTFWQAAPAAVLGSLVWEVAGETNPASWNDMVNTSLGGIALGEMTYRVAGLIINTRKSGRKRKMQEVLATMVNPMNGFNRIVDGKWGKVAAYDAEDSLEVSVTVDGGARIVNKTASELFKASRTEVFASARLQYGNPFKDFKKPFDNFYILLELGNADTAKLNTLWVQGSLWGKVVSRRERSIKMLRLTMNYDFYKNTSFEYGGQSILLTWLAHFDPNKNWTINAELGGGAVILGASVDKYRVYPEARNYTYGSGLAIFTAADITYRNRVSYRVIFRSTLTGTLSGSSSSKTLHLATAELKWRIVKDLSLTGSWGNFELLGFYPGFETSDDIYPFLRFSLGYKIRL